MIRVKKDVMLPWIAKRVTELLGVEDEVLINFIVSLLEGKVRDGEDQQYTCVRSRGVKAMKLRLLAEEITVSLLVCIVASWWRCMV